MRPALFCLALAATTFCFSQETAATGLRFEQAGQGEPTVVFESGLGDGLSSWAKVQPEIASVAATFSYSRAGEEGSSESAQPRDAEHVVAELRTLLAQHGVRPPYVLVGHSLGGIFVQYFARKFPAEIAGVVLVDSSHPRQVDVMRGAQPQAYAARVAQMEKVHSAPGQEFAAFETAQHQARDAGEWPAVPTIVLSAVPPDHTPATAGRWIFFGLQHDLAALLPGSKLWFAEHSGHYIQRDDPELVIRAIREVLDETKKAGPAKVPPK